MVKTGVNSNWKRVVTKNQSSLSHLRGYKGISMTKTTLKSFKDVEEVVKQFNKSLEKLEVYSETESIKMIQVANNKVSDDASYNK